jgi:hypothetical protein
MRWWTVLAAMVTAGGCVTTGGPDALALRTVGHTRLLDVFPDGGVVSADYQLEATPEGYWGTVGDGTVDLNAQGDRVFGVIGNGVVNMRLRVEGDAVRLQGLYGGRVGGLAADARAISSWLGRCYYDLRAVGNRYQGQRNCYRGPGVQPATVELPASFGTLPPQRRAMLLALLLAG